MAEEGIAAVIEAVMDADVPATDHALDALRECYRLYRVERLGELRGKRNPRFDPQGLHPPSRAWGTFSALRDDAWQAIGPLDVRRAAEGAAMAEFLAETNEISEDVEA